MTVFALGDIQGCYRELRALLEQVHYDSNKDSLWLTGDIINRGPDNVETLQFLMDQSNVQVVLGNHDLHFLAIASGIREQLKGDTLSDLLEHKELDTFTDWLRKQPLIRYDPDYGTLLVHAGVPGIWDLETAMARSDEVFDQLTNNNYRRFLQEMYGNKPSTWHNDLTGFARLRLITNFFTRMRFYRHPGEIELSQKKTQAPQGFKPWFDYRNPSLQKITILFGHWAALGCVQRPYLAGLDTGCVWGRHLTALRVEDGRRFKQQALL